MLQVFFSLFYGPESSKRLNYDYRIFSRQCISIEVLAYLVDACVSLSFASLPSSSLALFLLERSRGDITLRGLRLRLICRVSWT